MILRDSDFRGHSTLAAVLEAARPGVGGDKFGYRKEFLELVERYRKSNAARGD